VVERKTIKALNATDRHGWRPPGFDMEAQLPGNSQAVKVARIEASDYLGSIAYDGVSSLVIAGMTNSRPRRSMRCANGYDGVEWFFRCVRISMASRDSPIRRMAA